MTLTTTLPLRPTTPHPTRRCRGSPGSPASRPAAAAGDDRVAGGRRCGRAAGPDPHGRAVGRRLGGAGLDRGKVRDELRRDFPAARRRGPGRRLPPGRPRSPTDPAGLQHAGRRAAGRTRRAGGRRPARPCRPTPGSSPPTAAPRSSPSSSTATTDADLPDVGRRARSTTSSAVDLPAGADGRGHRRVAGVERLQRRSTSRRSTRPSCSPACRR